MEVDKSMRWRVSKDKKKNGTGLERDRAKKERILLKRLLKAEKRKAGGRHDTKMMNKDAEGTAKQNSDLKIKIRKVRKERKTVKGIENIAEVMKTRVPKARKKPRRELIESNLDAKTLEELLIEHEDQKNQELASLEPSISNSFSSTSKNEKIRQKKYVEISKVTPMMKKYVRRAELWKTKYHRLKNKLKAAEADRLSNSFQKSLLISNQT